MNDTDNKHMDIHINELLLPAGTRMPDQATLRRLVEAELQRRLTAQPRDHATQAAPSRGTRGVDVAGAVADHIQRHHPQAEK